MNKNREVEKNINDNEDVALDTKFYYSYYPDLHNLQLEEELLKHWQKYGKPEKRFPNMMLLSQAMGFSFEFSQLDMHVIIQLNPGLSELSKSEIFLKLLQIKEIMFIRTSKEIESDVQFYKKLGRFYLFGGEEEKGNQLLLYALFLKLKSDSENNEIGKYVTLFDTLFALDDNTLDMSESIKNLLEQEPINALNALYQSFPTLYKTSQTTIKAFDVARFLEVNTDLKSLLSECSKEALESYFFESGLDEIQKGIRFFDKEYLAYNEDLYQKTFRDVRMMIKNPDSSVQSAFDHFVLSGYEQIMSGKRLWPKKEDNKKEDNKKEESITIESIDVDHYWLKISGVKHNLFYLYIFLRHLNDKKYLDANEDVRLAIEADDFESVADHIVYDGMNDFIAGHRSVYAGVDLKTSILGSADNAYRIHNEGIFVSGWLYATKEMGGIEKVYLSDGLRGEDIIGYLSFFPRPDLDTMIGSAHKKAGFYAYINSKIIDLASITRYSLIVVTKNGLSHNIPFHVTEINSIKEVSHKILDPLQIDNNLYDNLTKNIGSVLCDYMEEYPLCIDEESIVREHFGQFVNNPKVSIIIPLYGRIDFVEYQLSQFANDPFFTQEVDLIYVLDDPSLIDEFITLVQGIYPIYEIPFSVVTYTQNYGYAVANNIGARYARAPKLLLLNSDVMPLEKGWLSKLIDIYDNLEGVGALAPKLLFEDGAVQHAGMVFEKSQTFKMWLNEHPGKGLPDLSTEQNPKVVPAVTAACLLVDAFLYEKVGGLSENYLIGDFEDSDFCLKLTENKKLSYYVPSVSLCHLERQSQNLFNDNSWKTKVTLFNGWQHDRKWNRLMNELMEAENAK